MIAKQVFAIAVLLLAAQAPWTSLADAAAESSLEDTTWVLESFGVQAGPTPLLSGTSISVRFDSATGRLAGRSGCNDYSGIYQAQGGELSVSVFERRLLSCGELVMQQEAQYTAALKAAQRYEIAGGQLEISHSGDRVLVFNVESATTPVPGPSFMQWGLVVVAGLIVIAGVSVRSRKRMRRTAKS